MRVPAFQSKVVKPSMRDRVQRKCSEHYWISRRHFSKSEPVVNVENISWVIGADGKRRVECLSTLPLIVCPFWKEISRHR